MYIHQCLMCVDVILQNSSVLNPLLQSTVTYSMATFTRETTGIEVVNTFNDVAEGRTILITGTSDGGMGAETAFSLAHANPALLLLLARTENKVTPVISKIKALNPSIKVTFVPIELDDFDSVRNAAGIINETITKLDIMINNAGIMAVPFATNKNNIESQFVTNHLGHFLLTALVHSKIRAAGKNARIVNLTSDGYMIGPCRLDDVNFNDGKDYDRWSGYGQAKTANILFTRQLASKGIVSFAVHPGGESLMLKLSDVALFAPSARNPESPFAYLSTDSPSLVIFGTNLSNHLEGDGTAFNEIKDIAIRNTGMTFQVGEPKSIQQGVATTLITALDPRITDRTGSYWADAKEEPLREYASSLENAQRLWTLSEKLVGEKFEL